MNMRVIVPLSRSQNILKWLRKLQSNFLKKNVIGIWNFNCKNRSITNKIRNFELVGSFILCQRSYSLGSPCTTRHSWKSLHKGKSWRSPKHMQQIDLHGQKSTRSDLVSTMMNVFNKFEINSLSCLSGNVWTLWKCSRWTKWMDGQAHSYANGVYDISILVITGSDYGLLPNHHQIIAQISVGISMEQIWWQLVRNYSTACH